MRKPHPTTRAAFIFMQTAGRVTTPMLAEAMEIKPQAARLALDNLVRMKLARASGTIRHAPGGQAPRAYVLVPGAALPQDPEPQRKRAFNGRRKAGENAPVGIPERTIRRNDGQPKFVTTPDMAGLVAQQLSRG